jgi:hypothetical protein
MTRTAVALAAGLVLLAIGLGVTLSRSPVVVIGANAARPGEPLAEAAQEAGACQWGEVLPRGTSAIRLTLRSVAGPHLNVAALSGTHLLTSGVTGSGWTAGSVTVPVRPVVARTTSHVEICFKVGPTKEKVAILGEPSSSAAAAAGLQGQSLPGRFKVEYLRVSHSSWWSVVPQVARRMGLGRAPAGTLIVVLPLIAMLGAILACASWLTLRELR